MENKRKDITMIVWVGAGCFVLGANLGFLLAGLMQAAREEREQTKDEDGTG